MAAAAQTTTTQAIALETMTTPLTAPNSTDATEQHVSHQPNHGATPQAQNTAITIECPAVRSGDTAAFTN